MAGLKPVYDDGKESKIEYLKNEIIRLRSEVARRADINQLQNEINDIKASLNAVNDAEKAVEEAKINNQFIKEAELPDVDIKYESLTVPTGGTFQRYTKVGIDTDTYVLKTPKVSVNILEDCVIVQSLEETRIIYF